MQSWTTTSNTTRTIDDGRPRSVTVNVVGGRVNVVSGPPGSTALDLEIADVRGQAITVTDDDGAVRIEQYKAPGGDIVESVKAWFRTRTPITGNITLTVPPTTQVLVRSLSAPVVVSGITASVGVNTATGSVTLSSLSGAIDVKTGSGDVTGNDITGGLKAKTVSGRLTLIDSSPKSVRGNSVTGVTTLDLRGGSLVTANSVSGDITLRAPATQGYDITAQSASGHVVADGHTLTGGDDGSRGGHRHEGDRSLAVKARSVSGNIVLVRGEASGPLLTGTDGHPGAESGDVQDVLTGEAPDDAPNSTNSGVNDVITGDVPDDSVHNRAPSDTEPTPPFTPPHTAGTGHRPGQVPSGSPEMPTADNPGTAGDAPSSDDTGTGR